MKSCNLFTKKLGLLIYGSFIFSEANASQLGLILSNIEAPIVNFYLKFL